MIWRILGGLLLVASYLTTVAFGSQLPNFEASGELAAEQLAVDPADLSLICPGAYWQLGGSAGTRGGKLDQLGSSTISLGVERQTAVSLQVTGGGEAALDASAAPRQLELARESALTLVARQLDTPALSAEQLSLAQGSKQLTAASVQRVNLERAGGLTAANCVAPSFSSRLLAGSTTAARESLLVLVNPGPVASQLSLSAYTESGKVELGGAGQFAVEANSTRVLSLATLIAEAQSIYVEIEASESPIAAWIQHKKSRGTLASGIALTGSSEPAASELVIPGLFIREPERIEQLAASERDFLDARPVLRLFSKVDSEVTVEIVGATKTTFGTVFSASLEAERVLDIPIEGLEAGDYSIFLTSNTEVLASAMLTRLQPDEGAGRASDFTWLTAAPLVSGTQALVAPAAGVTKVSIANPNADPVLVYLSAASSADASGDSAATPEAIAVAARSTVTRELPAGARVTLEAAQPVAASLILDRDFTLGSWTLCDYRNAFSTVSLVYR